MRQLVSVKGQLLSLFCLAVSAGPVNAATMAFSTSSPWMFGDWDGSRYQLEKDGVSFQAGYTMEAAANLAGGYHSSTTARYSDQENIGINLDLDKQLNWKNTEFQFTVTNRDGQNLSDLVADPRTGMLSSVQEVYGRGQTWRLTQLWLRKGLFDNVLDIKAGRLTVGEDFDNFDSKFQNLAFGSGQAGNWRGDHWYNWPVSQWGVRTRINFTPEVFLQTGFYNQNPYNYERGDGFRFEFSPTEGNLIPVELGWKPVLGKDKLPGNYRLGYYYSSTRDPVYSSYHNSDYGDKGSHSYGGYILLQQQLTALKNEPVRGLSLTLQAVMNDHKTAKIDNYQSIAVTWKGLMDNRPQDEIGVGVARIHVNSDYTNMLHTQNRENGVYQYDSQLYMPVQKGSEYDYEIYYNIHIADWVQLRPNLQYVSAPGAVHQVDNAFIGGIGANLTF